MIILRAVLTGVLIRLTLRAIDWLTTPDPHTSKDGERHG